MAIERTDLKIEVSRTGDPAPHAGVFVRVTHLPTGLVEECAETRSTATNERRAIERLTERLGHGDH